MPSGRNFKKEAFLCGHYEAQDVLVEVDDVDLICLDPGRAYEWKELWQRRLMFRDISRKVVFLNPGLHKVRLSQEYDLFLVRCQTEKDLPDINAIENWREYCKVSVCWIDEMWAAQIPSHKYWLHALRQFDHIFVGCLGTVERLSRALGRTVRWLPGAVDALRFTPYPNPPARTIDVYSIGRRQEELHRRLLRVAECRQIFYMYDTFLSSSLSRVYDYRQHREHFANVAKRSRYFVVAPGKVDSRGETSGQSEVGYRYYEGAAAGAVMIGQTPKGEAFRQMFPWSEAVIHVEPDGCDVMQVLVELASDPVRVSAVAQRNAVGALLHHDWVYRWKEVLNVAGLEPSAALVSRECRLKDIATMIASPVKAEAVLEEDEPTACNRTQPN